MFLMFALTCVSLSAEMTSFVRRKLAHFLLRRARPSHALHQSMDLRYQGLKCAEATVESSSAQDPVPRFRMASPQMPNVTLRGTRIPSVSGSALREAFPAGGVAIPVPVFD